MFDVGIDYRLRTLMQANLWFTPIGGETDWAMRGCSAPWRRNISRLRAAPRPLEINHRPLPTLGRNGVAALDFADLCVGVRNVRPMSSDEENIVRRF